MENRHKIIFVGAGVSNLAAANRLLDYSINDFIIIEQGNFLNQRNCPGENSNTCKRCQNGCSTLEGVGGSNALHGNKLCYFPASDGILNYFSNNEIDSAINFLDDLLFPFFDKSLITQKVNYIDKKHYTSDVFNKKDFASLIERLTRVLKNKIITRTKVVKIEKKPEEFCIHTSKGHKCFCEILVMGTGRASYKFLPNQLKQLNVEYYSQIQDIGIRIETHKDCFTKDYYYQVDPKYKYSWDGLGSGRTFCAHNQGKVVPVKFGNSFFADGAFDRDFGNFNNIALMVRGLQPLSTDDLENWCSAINAGSDNNLLLGSVELNKPENEIIKQILNLIKTFPTNSHKLLMEKLLLKVFTGKNKLIEAGNNLNSTLNIYGPAIDRQWVVPAIDDNFQVRNLQNLYLVGDAIGQSRGFIQAMFSGAIWADRFVKVRTLQKMEVRVRTLRKKEECLNLE
ncbi:MAG TPA: hypothetical protein PLW77_03750 [Bacteroidales bacterium]|nr:hypothetical protein [Bacteroidales bacterium]HQB21373.1 hypothetical protein [Bacteroidales bacterium]